MLRIRPYIRRWPFLTHEQSEFLSRGIALAKSTILTQTGKHYDARQSACCDFSSTSIILYSFLTLCNGLLWGLREENEGDLEIWMTKDLDILEIIVIFERWKYFRNYYSFEITNYENKIIDVVVKSIDAVHLSIVYVSIFFMWTRWWRYDWWTSC